MAVKGKKCQNMKDIEWISSSFYDSFGLMQDGDFKDDSVECCSPAEKRVKLEDPSSGSCYGSDSIPVEDVLFKKNLHIDRVWTDKYAPKKSDDLVVHKKKIAEVNDYLKNIFEGNGVHKILLISGPTGCGKTCTLNILCRHLNVNIIEWATPIDKPVGNNYESDYSAFDSDLESNKSFGHTKAATVQSFDEFILQAAKYSSLLSMHNHKKIVLVKDFPNVFLEHAECFHETIRKYYNIAQSVPLNRKISPVVFVISDTNIIHELFPDELKFELNITNISFNPVTSPNIVKALDRILSLELKNSSLKPRPSKNEVVSIAESSDGDLRSAILKLQFTLSNVGSNSVFKVPNPPVCITKSERIRVIKSTSKLKNTKHKICEIDKDKTVDFFSSVGRVLYPKKDFLDESRRDYRFVHSPSAIVDSYLSQPNKFVNILHENYLERFTHIKDVTSAADSISISDLLLSSFWEAKDVMVQYSLNSVVRSLMVSNSNPAPKSFKPISKSKVWITDNQKKANEDSIRQIFPNCRSEKDVLLDIVPYLYKLKLNANLTKEQSQIISNITKYNH